ncbi:MAG: hypothetical protein IJZ92_06780 [Bacteroidaceae bacterium]|nr:hypothetical protein [Bacteroidaceae bacterium]
MRFLTLLLFVVVSVGGMFAQKAYRPIKTALKAKNGKDALASVRKLETDSVHASDPKLYLFGIEAYQLMNDVENEKMYLKKNADTTAFFNSTLGIFEYALKCDSVERYLQQSIGKKPKYRKQNNSLVKQYVQNLKVAANYYYTRKNYANAVRYYDMILKTQSALTDEKTKEIFTDDEVRQSAFRHLYSNYIVENYKSVPLYKDLALQDTLQRCLIYEVLAKSAAQQQDTVKYMEYLYTGISKYPRHSFFFTNIADRYAHDGDYKRILALADTLLLADSTNIVLLEGKCVALINLKQYHKAIASAEKCLQSDSTLLSSYYYIGACYCNLAGEVVLPTNINSTTYRKAYTERKDYYTKALPYLEHFRQQAPEQKKYWAPLLYKIYLNLNMGAKFEEIDRILKE